MKKYLKFIPVILLIGAIGFFITMKTGIISLTDETLPTVNKLSVSELEEKDLNQVFKDLDQKGETLIRNLDGTYSSISKEQAQNHYNKIAQDPKLREQFFSTLKPEDPLIGYSEMLKAGLVGKIN